MRLCSIVTVSIHGSPAGLPVFLKLLEEVMVFMAFSFYGGIHPKDRKDLAREQAIVAFPPPATVVIPMSQHIGAPCKPLVSKGDHVDLGQKNR